MKSSPTDIDILQNGTKKIKTSYIAFRKDHKQQIQLGHEKCFIFQGKGTRYDPPIHPCKANTQE